MENNGHLSSMKCLLKFNKVEFINNSKVEFINFGGKTYEHDLKTIESFSVIFLQAGMKEYHKKFKDELNKRFKEFKLEFKYDENTLIFTGLKENIESIKRFYDKLISFDMDFKRMNVHFENFPIGAEKMILNYDSSVFYNISKKGLLLFGQENEINEIRAKLDKFFRLSQINLILYTEDLRMQMKSDEQDCKIISLFYLDDEYFENFKNKFKKEIEKETMLAGTLVDLIPNEFLVKGVCFFNDINLLKKNKDSFIKILKLEYAANVKIQTFNYKVPLNYLSFADDDFYLRCVKDFKSNAVTIIRYDTNSFGLENNIYFDNIRIAAELTTPLENQNQQNVEIKFYGTEKNIEKFKKVMLIPTELKLLIKNTQKADFIKEIVNAISCIELKVEKNSLIIEGVKSDVIFYSRFFTEIIANKRTKFRK